MSEEEFFERAINRICKDYDYNFANELKNIYLKKDKKLQQKDKEIERLKKDNEYLNKVNIELSTEKNRLNNIVNELEKTLIEEIEDYDKHINSKFITNIVREQYEGEKVCFEDMLNKLQELKGSEK